MEYASQPIDNYAHPHQIFAGVPLHPTKVQDALQALELVTARLSALKDGRAAFPAIYGIITRRVAEEVSSKNGRFLEPLWISRLAGRFCERYLETLRWSFERTPQDAGAWHIAYIRAQKPESTPALNVLCGISAHINYDLALGIRDNIVAFGHRACPEMIARYKHDHDQVNHVLEASIPEALDRLSRDHGCPMSAFARKRALSLTRWCTMQLLSSWRAQVWADARRLLAATNADEKARLVGQMDQRSTRIGEILCHSLAVRPARLATTAASSAGSMGLGR